MSNRDVREYASTYFLPLLLGSNKRSHKISSKILRKYGIMSFVLDEKRSVYDFFDVSSHFVRLCQAIDPSILSDELESIAKRYEDILPILVPCSPKYEQLVDKIASELETTFVICNAEEVFISSPLCDIS